MNELRIKNLTISLEALSRINNNDANSQYNRISEILDKLILEAEEYETNRIAQQHVAVTRDGEIPF